MSGSPTCLSFIGRIPDAALGRRFEHVDIDGKVVEDFLQSFLLAFELLEPLRIVAFYPAVLVPPPIAGGLGDVLGSITSDSPCSSFRSFSSLASSRIACPVGCRRFFIVLSSSPPRGASDSHNGSR